MRTREISVFIDESGSYEDNRLSESERVFFGGVKNFKKNYLKLLDRRSID